MNQIMFMVRIGRLFRKTQMHFIHIKQQHRQDQDTTCRFQQSFYAHTFQIPLPGSGQKPDDQRVNKGLYFPGPAETKGQKTQSGTSQTAGRTGKTGETYKGADTAPYKKQK